MRKDGIKKFSKIKYMSGVSLLKKSAPGKPFRGIRKINLRW